MESAIFPAAVVIETSRYVISGDVTLPPHARLSDYANDAERGFFAVTQAHVAPIDQPERGRYVPFVLVARHEIGLMYPATVQAGAAEDPNRAAMAAHLEAFMNY